MLLVVGWKRAFACVKPSAIGFPAIKIQSTSAVSDKPVPQRKSGSYKLLLVATSHVTHHQSIMMPPTREAKHIALGGMPRDVTPCLMRNRVSASTYRVLREFLWSTCLTQCSQEASMLLATNSHQQLAVARLLRGRHGHVPRGLGQHHGHDLGASVIHAAVRLCQ